MPFPHELPFGTKEERHDVNDFIPPPPVAGSGVEELLARYHALSHTDRLSWTAPYRLVRQLGSGGQGVVFLGERQGADHFRLPVALKVFSPESYRDAEAYQEDMERIAHVAARVALIQHDNLIDIHDFIQLDGLRIMEMEWVDGYNLREVLTPRMLDCTRERVDARHWKYVNNVILTQGPVQPRMKPGVAIQVLRECLAGLAALHREGIVHGDLKPSNIMLKRTGDTKVIDIGSAIDRHAAAGAAHVVAGLRRPGSARRRRELAASRPGQSRLRPD